jgi:hypothetical protein
MAYDCKHFVLATQLWTEAFAADPGLANDLRTAHRYDAARAAVLASNSSLGGDATKLDDQERTRIRRQALGWLRADLVLLTGQIDSGLPADRDAAQQALRRWQDDNDLAGIREATALEKLPLEDRSVCEKLWSEVAALEKTALEKASQQRQAHFFATDGENLLRQQKWDEAERAIRKALALREKVLPDDWLTFNARSMLGGALLGQKQYAEAEPLLLAGYEGMKRLEKSIPPGGNIRLGQAVERLAQLCEALDKKDEAKKWRAERAKYPAEQPPARVQTPSAADREIAAGRTQDALVHLVTQSAAQPNDTLLFAKLAALQAWFGRAKELAETCRRGLALAKNSTVPETAERVAKACCVIPSTDTAQLEAALELARKALRLGESSGNRPWFQMALGMAEYRSGHFAEADTVLASAAMIGEKNPHVAGTAAFYRSMTLFRLGKEDEARKLATEAAAAMKPLPKDEKNPLAGNASHDDLILWMAYKEAKALIKFEPSPTAPAPPKGK